MYKLALILFTYLSAPQDRTTIEVFHSHGEKALSCAANANDGLCLDMEHWIIAIGSMEYTPTTLAGGLKSEAQQFPQHEILLLAEREAPYGCVQRVIESCYGAGFSRISVGLREPEPISQEIRIALFWDRSAQTPIVKFGSRVVKSEEELAVLLRSARIDFEKLNAPAVKVTIDSAGEVPWHEIVKLVNFCRRENLLNIEFATNRIK